MPEPAPVTEAELALLQFLWSRPEATTRELAALLYRDTSDPKLASVQKLLERLEAKGCVDRDRHRRPHRFRAMVSSEHFLRTRLQELADRLCGGRLAPLVTTLLRSEGLSAAERSNLRTLVDELWPNPSGKRSSK